MDLTKVNIGVVVLFVFIVTLFVKDYVDRDMVADLQKEVENCVEINWEDQSGRDSVMSCIREVWSWNFDWQD